MSVFIVTGVCFQGLFLQRDDDEEESSLMRESLGGGGVADYKFGRLIAKGCHAAVYEASINHTSGNYLLVSYQAGLSQWLITRVSLLAVIWNLYLLFDSLQWLFIIKL